MYVFLLQTQSRCCSGTLGLILTCSDVSLLPRDMNSVQLAGCRLWLLIGTVILTRIPIQIPITITVQMRDKSLEDWVGPMARICS